MRWPYRHPHVLLPAMHDAQAVLAKFLPLINWHSFRRLPLDKRLTVDDFAGLCAGCGDRHQAIVCLMPGETHCGKASRIEISDLSPGCYDVTQMNTVTGQRETSNVRTRLDGTLVVVVTGTSQDTALAITPSSDSC